MKDLHNPQLVNPQSPVSGTAPGGISDERRDPSAAALPDELYLMTHAHRDALRSELRPKTALESILVEEMARNAAAMEFSGNAEGRVLTFAARHRELLQHGVTGDKDLELEAMFTAAITSNATERVERFAQLHRRAFYRAYGQLQLLRAQDRECSDVGASTVFQNERACEMYLIGRMQAAPQHCPSCGKKKRLWLRCRRRWECAACGAQHGLKTGTVMMHSPLPLATWFAAILAVCAEPKIAARDLAERVGLRRLATVRGMLKKIRIAIESADAENLLAGLHRLDPAQYLQ